MVTAPAAEPRTGPQAALAGQLLLGVDPPLPDRVGRAGAGMPGDLEKVGFQPLRVVDSPVPAVFGLEGVIRPQSGSGHPGDHTLHQRVVVVGPVNHAGDGVVQEAVINVG